MGDKKGNTKESEKIKFFKIGREGSIRPAFPNKEEPDDEKTSNTRSVMEPLIGGPPTEPLTQEFKPKAEPDPRIEEQLHLLKPQVDDISRIPDQGSLTQDQVEVLRKYISLKEAEARDMREQRRQYQAFLKKLSSQMEEATNRNRELLTEVEVLRRRNEALIADHRDMREKYSGEMKVLQSELEDKLKKADPYDLARDSLRGEQEEWKQKIREELKRIKLKERELENKYELLKRDAQALLDSKDRHVLELKKKSDALELEMESLEERLRKGNVILNSIDSKKKRLVETMKLAITLLEAIDQADASADDDKPRKAG